jgi:hypothetical protein
VGVSRLLVAPEIVHYLGIVVKLDAARAGDYDVDLLSLPVPMGEGLALPWLDDQVIETRLLSSQIATRKACLLTA